MSIKQVKSVFLLWALTAFFFTGVSPRFTFAAASRVDEITQPLSLPTNPVKELIFSTSLEVDQFVQQQLKIYKPFKKLKDFLHPDLRGLENSDYLVAGYHAFLSGRFDEFEIPANYTKPLTLELAKQSLAESFANYRSYENDSRRPIDLIELNRMGSEHNFNEEALLRAFYQAGFKVTSTALPVEEFQKNLENLPTTSDVMMSRVEFKDQVFSKHSSKNSNLEQRYWAFRTHLEELASQWRHQLGIARGVTFLTFKETNWARTRKMRQIEGLAAAVTAAGVSFAVYKTVEQKQFAGQLVNLYLPLAVSISDKLFFGYFQQPVSSFFGQGRNFDFSKNTFTLNKKFFLIAVYLNSLVLREALTAATNMQIDLSTWTVQFGLTWALVEGAAGSSLRGLYSKAPLQIGIERLRQMLSATRPMLAMAIMTGWNTFWGAVQVGDIYDLSYRAHTVFGDLKVDVRSVMTVLAIAGISIDFWKDILKKFVTDPTQISKNFERIKKILNGEPLPSCEALLTVRVVQESSIGK